MRAKLSTEAGRASVAKWRDTMKKRYGDYREHMRQIGIKGGSAERDGLRGFALNRELAKKAGRKGGLSKTKRVDF